MNELGFVLNFKLFKILSDYSANFPFRIKIFQPISYLFITVVACKSSDLFNPMLNISNHLYFLPLKVHEQPVATLTTTVNDAPLEPIYVSTPVGENFNSQQLFSVDSGVSRAFKVEINGAHLIRMNPEGHSISGNDRQIRTIYTTPQSATTLAAT